MTLGYENYGILLILGNAGFISSAVAVSSTTVAMTITEAITIATESDDDYYNYYSQ